MSKHTPAKRKANKAAAKKRAEKAAAKRAKKVTPKPKNTKLAFKGKPLVVKKKTKRT